MGKVIFLYAQVCELFGFFFFNIALEGENKIT